MLIDGRLTRTEDIEAFAGHFKKVWWHMSLRHKISIAVFMIRAMETRFSHMIPTGGVLGFGGGVKCMSNEIQYTIDVRNQTLQSKRR